MQSIFFLSFATKCPAHIVNPFTSKEAIYLVHSPAAAALFLSTMSFLRTVVAVLCAAVTARSVVKAKPTIEDFMTRLAAVDYLCYYRCTKTVWRGEKGVAGGGGSKRRESKESR